MLDLVIFAFFFLTLELVYLYRRAEFVVVAPLMVFLLVLFHKLDKIEAALSEEKRNAGRAFEERKGLVGGVAVLVSLGMCLAVYWMYEQGYLPRDLKEGR